MPATTDKNKIAKVVIPLAIIFWLLGILIKYAPPFFLAVYVVAFIVSILAALLYLFNQTGYSELAQRYPEKVPFRDRFLNCPTLHVSTVSVTDPDYNRLKTRYVGLMAIGASPDFLYIAPIFRNVPILRNLLPTAQIPWSAITSANSYSGSGFVQSPSSPGTLLQITYDPGMKGDLLELGIGEPPVFIQLKADILGDLSRLPLKAVVERK
jgi:hypothetical protein